MNYIKISKMDTANGKGIGCVLWVSGCTHKCPFCHNPETWDFNYGKEFTDDSLMELREALSKPYISRLTFSGGDPLNPKNRETVCFIAQYVKNHFPNITIWCYTGYTFEEVSKYLGAIDVLVDGEFKIDLKDISLPFCGSSNQRIIDVKASKKSGKIINFSL